MAKCKICNNEFTDYPYYDLCRACGETDESVFASQASPKGDTDTSVVDKQHTKHNPETDGHDGHTGYIKKPAPLEDIPSDDLARKIYNRLLAADYISNAEFINHEQGEHHIKSVIDENLPTAVQRTVDTSVDSLIEQLISRIIMNYGSSSVETGDTAREFKEILSCVGYTRPKKITKQEVMDYVYEIITQNKEPLDKAYVSQIFIALLKDHDLLDE